MASDDVIELGSSDDEQTPSPRKPKPRPNAMVHIPKSLPGFSMNTKKKIPFIGIIGNQSKSPKKILPNPFSPLNRIKNGAPVKYLKTLPASDLYKAAMTNTLTTTKRVNIPISHNIGVKNAHLVQKCTQSQKEAKAQCLNKLPPGITVTRTAKTDHVDRKRTMPLNIPATVIIKKPKLQNKVLQNRALQNKSLQNKALQSKAIQNKALQNEALQNNALQNIALQNKALQNKALQNKALQNKALHKVGAVLTIEVDKDDNTASSMTIPPLLPTVVRPEWYVKPEDYQKADDIEEQNNKEPEPIKYVEITIEDSPIKVLPDKRILEMGIETPIVIEDSPGKPNNKNKTDGNCTDHEDDKISSDTCAKNIKTPHSKKRLNYPNDDSKKDTSVPKENDKINENKDNLKVKNSTMKETVPVNNETIVLEDDEVPQLVQNKIINKPLSTIEIEDSPMKKNNNMLKAITREFHPFYQRFIDLCFKLEDSEDMNKIVEKKLKTYYRQVPKSYVESEDFLEMVSSKITAMEVTPERMYLHIKDIVDELNYQRKNTKSQTTEENMESTEMAETEVVPLSEDGNVDTKKQNQIRKLEKVLKKLHKAIQKLEEQEVNFDDDADSVYLLTDRYKERLVRVHKKICQLTNTKMPSDPRVRVEPRSGRPNGPARKVEDLINKKGAIKSFPDFHDVLRCVKEANIEDKLGWNDVDIMEEARDLFTRCGKKLQRRRQETDWRIASYRLDNTIDPAEQSEELKIKLERNSRIAAEKESAVINRYADRQNQLNLEAVEIGDKEAEESPIESDDEVEIIDEKATKVDKELVTSDKKEENSTIVNKETEDIECVATKSTTDNANVDEDNTSNDTNILISDSCSDNASECLDLSDDCNDKPDTEVVSIEDSSSSEDEEEDDGNTINCDVSSDTEKDDTDHHKTLTPEKPMDIENDDTDCRKTLTPEKPIGNDQTLEDVKHNDQEVLNKADGGTESSAESQDQDLLTKEKFEVSSVEIVSLEDTQSPKDTHAISDDIQSISYNDSNINNDIEKDDTDHHKTLTLENLIGTNQILDDLKHNDQETLNNVDKNTENNGTEPSDESQDQDTLTKDNFEVNSVEIVSLEDTQSPKDNHTTTNDIPSICSNDNDIKNDIEKENTDHHKTLTPQKPIGNNIQEDVKHIDKEVLNKVDEDTENKGTESLVLSQDQDSITKENFEVYSVDIVSLEDTQSPKDTTDAIIDDIPFICSNDIICKINKVESMSLDCKIDSNTTDITDSNNGNLNHLDGDVVKQVDNIESNKIDSQKMSIDETIEANLEKLFNT